MFDDFLSALEEDEFEERPVTVEEFVTNEDYLHLPPLSPYQYQAIRAITQIYKKDTLIKLYGEEEGLKRYRQTCNEVILQLGKGSTSPETEVFDPSTGKWIKLCDIRKDTQVYSDDGELHYATESFYEGTGSMVRVKTSLGITEDVYVEHKFLAYNKNKFYKRYRGYLPKYTQINELNIGDRIAVGIGMEPSNPNNIPKEHAELIGYWLGDGMMPTENQPMINVDFCDKEVESIQRYVELCEKIGDKAIPKKHNTKNLIYFRHYKNSESVTLAYHYGLNDMRSRNKYIPDAVWASDNSTLAKVIEKLWQTDGCVYQKNGGTAEFVSVSERLAKDVQKSLLRLGVPSSIRSRVPKSNFDNASTAWYVTVSSQEAFNRFCDVINLLDHKSPTRLNKSGRIYKRIDNNIYWDRIVSVEPIGEGEYWTLTVPDTANYIASFISANSGKDYLSTISVAYLVYLLLCLKDPAKYFGKPPGDAIDIINIAINSEQAKNVFFKGFRKRIEDSPWFAGKFSITAQSITFDKSITCHSGHSERESWEGYNVICVILDEISGFSTVSTSGNEQSKTGQAIYDMYRASVDSRFPDFGKVVLLSFPRYKNDFIQQRYDAVVADKEVVIKSHTFKLDEELEGIKENEFTIEWEEDQITAYKYPKVFALKRPTWDINPTRSINDFKIAFYNNPVDALGRFACMPPDAVDAFFKSREKILACFNQPMNGVDEDGRFKDWFIPQEGKEYYIHVDLAQKHDHCAVAMSHVDRWVKIKSFMNHNVVSPIVVVDCVRWWTPTADKSVDFSEVKQFIIDLRSRGFNIKKVTFDRWQSHDIQSELRMAGIETETLSVAKKHYDDMAMLVGEERIIGPEIKLLTEELLQLRIIRDKVDHPRKGSKDLSDAVCGSIYNSISNTRKQTEEIEIEVHTYKQFIRDQRREEAERNVITPPASNNNIDDYIQSIGMV